MKEELCKCRHPKDKHHEDCGCIQKTPQGEFMCCLCMGFRPKVKVKKVAKAKSEMCRCGHRKDQHMVDHEYRGCKLIGCMCNSFIQASGNPKKGTYKTAAMDGFHDEKARKAFLKLWESLGIMDLYEGNMEEYLAAIRSRVLFAEGKVKVLEKRLEDIHGLSNL
jgi:hypothetical protein